MKVLFIGGTGIISSACTQRALTKGIDLYHLNRGTSARPTPDGVTVLRGDIRDKASAQAALGDHHFDAVVEWIAGGRTTISITSWEPPNKVTFGRVIVIQGAAFVFFVLFLRKGVIGSLEDWLSRRADRKREAG